MLGDQANHQFTSLGEARLHHSEQDKVKEWQIVDATLAKLKPAASNLCGG